MTQVALLLAGFIAIIVLIGIGIARSHTPADTERRLWYYVHRHDEVSGE